MKKYLFSISLLLVLVSPRAKAAPVEVTVTPYGINEYVITLQTSIQAPRPAVWNVLTDYGHHTKILPYISKSQVVRKTDTGSVIEQEGKIHVLLWTFKMHMTQQVKEMPPERMEFHTIAGDFERLEGVWQLTEKGGNTRISCEFQVQPKRHVPEWAVRFTARHYLATMVRSLQRHAERHSV